MRRSRHNKPVCDCHCRNKETHEISFNDNILSDLIYYNSIIASCIALLACSLTKTQIKAHIFGKIIATPCAALHTQIIERCVHQVSEANIPLYINEKTEASIKAQAVSRKINRSSSKKDVLVIMYRKIYLYYCRL